MVQAPPPSFHVSILLCHLFKNFQTIPQREKWMIFPKLEDRSKCLSFFVNEEPMVSSVLVQKLEIDQKLLQID